MLLMYSNHMMVIVFKNEYQMAKNVYQMVIWHAHVTIWYTYA